MMTVAQDPNQLALMDQEVFEQILELDEDEHEHEFSKELVVKFFAQAQETLMKMNERMYVFIYFLSGSHPLKHQLIDGFNRNENDLVGYAKLGHFLKGSSGQLGLNRMHHICKSMQELGTGLPLNTPFSPQQKQQAMMLLEQASTAFMASQKHLKEFFRL